MAHFHSMTVGVLWRQAKSLYLFYLFPPRRFLQETHFGCTATRLFWKLRFCFCEPSQGFTPFRGVAFTEHFLKSCCTFFGASTSVGWERHQHIEQRLHNSDGHFLWRLKEHFFSRYLQFANSGPQEKKTMVNLQSCCLLKIKILSQLLKDSKSVASVKLVFFFANTFKATLHKIRNFEKFSNNRLRWRESFTQNCAKQFPNWPPMLSDAFKAN